MSLLRSNIGCISVAMTGDLNSCHVIKHSDNWHPHYQAKPGGVALRFWNLFIHFRMDVDLDV